MSVDNPKSNETNLIDPDDPQQIVESFIPYMEGDDNKSKYMGYRATGFSVREALELVGVHERTLARWRADDPSFRSIETNHLGRLRREVGAEFTLAEFTRNMRMVMVKDAQIIQKALRPASREITEDGETVDIQAIDGLDAMTENERKYFFEIRKLYTPAQLQALRGAISGKDEHDGASTNFNIVQFIRQINTRQDNPHTRVIDHG